MNKMCGFKIVGLNQDIKWKDKIFNLKNIEKKFLNINADLLLLPEMFSTGFCMQPEEIADRNEEILEWMKSFAKEKNAAVSGSVSVSEDGKYYNRMYFVRPDGTFDKYDKRHLFSFSGENEVYNSGNERVVLEYKGIRILLQICYDLRFPVFSRNCEDYDLALYIANWPDKRVDAWNTLLKARAIENQAYVFGLNRIGTDGNGLNYSESSNCFFADGTVISTKKDNLVSAEINLDNLKKFKEKFQFWSDADGFDIIF